MRIVHPPSVWILVRRQWLVRTQAVVLACTLFTVELCGQDRPIELTGMYGYQFLGSHEVVRGELSMSASDAFGLRFGFRVQDDVLVELVYDRQDTKLRFEPPNGPRTDLGDVTVEYYQGAAVFELWNDGPIKPYVTAGAGVLRWDPDHPGGESDWLFSASFGAGLKVLPDRVGFRADFRFLVPFYGSAFSIGCGGAGDCFTSARELTVGVEGSLSAGMIVLF